MGIKCGIVGLPNVGKSTLFNALTAAEIPAENYPFCTIDPNVGVVTVPDPKLDAIAAIVKPEKVVPTVVEFVDIAGLVEGASQGQGLGNQFLAHIRETHAIAHLVRCFRNDDVIHVAGKIDPLHDIEVIDTELMLADLETVQKVFARAERAAKTNDKTAVARRDALQRLLDALENGRPARTVTFDDREGIEVLKELHLITSKPVMYVANVAEDATEDNPLVAPVRRLAEEQGAELVVISCALEAELAQLNEKDRAEFLASLGLEEPGLNRVIRAAYRLLGLKTFYTAGPKECRAWTVRREAMAPEAAGAIHTDFERGFIRAEVIGYDQFIARRGEAGAREAGELRLEGKTYVVQEGDVIHFRFNV
ncbi:MAG TPA: redox-regulated ATPase YchF [Gammaproteobacteria bacterium]|jgi:GTP-binding protein YchF|nr:redox-regulated ATPase YchF [Gammaproteobacteria bacterium]